MKIANTIENAGNIISIAKPILETIAPKILESMKDCTEGLLSLANEYPEFEEFAKKMDRAAEIAGDIINVLNIVSDPADVLGAKIENAGKEVGDFESTADYISYLKNDVDLDQEKFSSISAEKKIIYTVVGIAVETGAIGEKLGVNISADTLKMILKVVDIGKIAFEAADIIPMILQIKKEGISELGDICDFISGTGDSDRLKTGKILSKVMDHFYPGEGESIIDELKDEIRE